MLSWRNGTLQQKQKEDWACEMAKEKFNFERIEMIPPAWAMAPGTEDTVIAYSVLPAEIIYIIIRQRPPREVAIGQKYDYDVGSFGQVRRRPKSGEYEYKTGYRRMAPEWYREIRARDNIRVISKNRLIVEEAYFEWLDADQKVPFEFAFPGHPELLKLSRENPLANADAAKRFWEGRSGRSHNMESTGDKLYSYGTVIAQRLKDGSIVFNKTSYSSSTTGHQWDALRWGNPNYYVYGVRMGAHDLERELMNDRTRLIASSFHKGKRYDVIVRLYGHAPPYYHEYFMETFGPDESLSRPLTHKDAYLEYRDAQEKYMSPGQAFDPRKYMWYQGRYHNPPLGKSHFHRPLEEWHLPTTKLLAYTHLKNSRHEMVDLYRTKKGNYFLQILALDDRNVVRYGWIRYLSRRQAIKEFRDADKKAMTFTEAFP